MHNKASNFESLPNALAVSTHIAGIIIKFTIGKKIRRTQYHGREIIFIKITALYNGINASQACRPALV